MGRHKTIVLGVMLGAIWMCTGVGAAPVYADGAGWNIDSLANPTNFSSSGSYLLTVTNVGSQASDGTPVTITDTLPPGVEFTSILTPETNSTGSGGVAGGFEWEKRQVFGCSESELKSGPNSGRWQVSCTYEKSVPAADVLSVGINVAVNTVQRNVSVLNEAQVQGGGVSVVAKTGEPAGTSGADPNLVNASRASFGIEDFSLNVYDPDGRLDDQAADHPYQVKSSFFLNSAPALHPTGSSQYEPASSAKDVVVYLPLGLVGDPLAAAQCPERDVHSASTLCPASSKIGTVAADLGGNLFGAPAEPKGLYNLTPEQGYPAEFGFQVLGLELVLYPSVVRTPSGYMLRVASPGILDSGVGNPFSTLGASLTFFGDPNADNGSGNAPAAFFRNPSDCTTEPQKARIEADSWVKPGEWVSKEVDVYPEGISGCDLLQFDPTLQVKPSETTQSDTPSSYEVDLKVPQSTDEFSILGTPDLRDATVTLPHGVSLSPSAANGLVGCQSTGPEGINIGSEDVTPEGRDLGDPEATELGAGHLGGDGSPYDDGLYHTAPGHCPTRSDVGEVEIKSPLLASTLKGHVYVAQPQCGGAAQTPCGEGSATDGQLYGLYLEVAGDGVIIKLHGKVSANPQTGQLETTFAENPQLPFEDLKLKLTGREQERAPLSNPQTCGPSTTVSELTPWGGATVEPTAEFDTMGCSDPMSFGPAVTVGTVNSIAGNFTSFVTTFTRKDGEQDLANASLDLPLGLSGMVSKVLLCAGPQADLGTCPEASRIGTVNVAAGAGSEPLWLSGPVYLTGPYKGAPFGLSIVVPAVAGPFNLGDVVERATINVNPQTAQVTVTSDPLPQIRDGVPFRLKTVNVTIDRPEFIFNPTNCSQLRVTGSVSGDMPDGSAGTTVPVSTPFAATGCKNLPFKPSFAVSTQASHTRNDGASLHVTLTSGSGQANVGSVKVDLPKQLPSRLSTLKLACPEAVFAANPASCPAGSVVGSVVAHTPVLPVPLTGPAYFVSHGGAKFPELIMVLEGDNVTLDLAGETFISSAGITSSTFRQVPDVPVTSFELTLPTGSHSALAGNGNFCEGAMYMPTEIRGQNGAAIKQNTKVTVTGCKPAVTVVRHNVKGANATVVVDVPAAGKLLVTGSGLSGSTRTFTKAGTATLKLSLTRKERLFLAKHPERRLKVRVKLLFEPTHGSRLSATVTLLLG